MAISRALALAKERVEQLTRKQTALEARDPRPYKKRPPYEIVYYRTLLDNDVILQLNAIEENITIFGGATDAGLKTTLAAGETGVKGARITPSKISWYFADANPTREKTKWGTTWTKVYDKDTKGQSHRSIPFSKASGTFGTNALNSAFKGFFEGTSGSKKAILGANGRAYLKFERQSIVAKPLQTVDLYDYLATPVIWSPNASPEEMDIEIDSMLARSLATREFLDGNLSYDDFEMALDQYGVNPIEAHAHWEDGYVMMP